MRKLDWKKIVLLLLPILAVGLATTVDSVMVFDSVAGTTEYYSYFDLIPDCNFAILMPLAGILSGICGILAAMLLAKKNDKMFKGIWLCSLCSAICAALPILLKGETIVFPNVGLPIFMMLECFFAYMMMNQPQTEAEAEHKRLEHR